MVRVRLPIAKLGKLKLNDGPSDRSERRAAARSHSPSEVTSEPSLPPPRPDDIVKSCDEICAPTVRSGMTETTETSSAAPVHSMPSLPQSRLPHVAMPCEESPAPASVARGGMTKTGSGRILKKSKRVHKKVCFAVGHTTIYGIKDMTEDEFSAVWYSDQEQGAINAEIANIVRDMRAGKADALYTRGLEHMRTRYSNQERKDHREDVCLAVLEEQDRQWALGKLDAEGLSIVAARATQTSRDIASSRGASDANSAQYFHNYSQSREEPCAAESLLNLRNNVC